LRLGFYATGSATGSYHDLLRQIVWAEQAGFDSAWLRERHFHRDHDGRNFFSAPIVAAAWIAARTSRLRIGLGARILPLDHPLRIAEDAATVDLLSAGRLDLGVARIGENDLYQDAFGVDPADARSRFEEALELIERAWTAGTVSFSGRHYTIPEVAVMPRPVQRPGPPIYLVGVSDATLGLGAERGMPLLLAGAQPEAEVARTVRDYRSRLESEGHDPAEVATPLNRFVYVAETTDRARAEMRPAIADFLDRPASVIRNFLGARAADLGEEMLLDEVFICGDADYCAERLESLQEALELDEFLLTFNYFTLSHDRCLESMQRFAEEVLPAVSAEGMART
jgi:alkanesulfonate monooxygenase SsuD/methylene tetrahydromethanopterin reductase-like flavin-dependent oxidoreductase (luciferase family)